MKQLYTSQVQFYPGAPHLQIGFPMRYLPGRVLASKLNQRIAKASRYYATVYTDTGLITSRDGRSFSVWPESLVRPGRSPEHWFHGFGGTALNLFETQSQSPVATQNGRFAPRITARGLDRERLTIAIRFGRTASSPRLPRPAGDRS